MIDLERVKLILREVNTLIEGLNGAELDETKAVTDQSKGDARRVRARLSQDLNLLAARLELASILVKNEYWFARGEADPLDPTRDDE